MKILLSLTLLSFCALSYAQFTPEEPTFGGEGEENKEEGATTTEDGETAKKDVLQCGRNSNKTDCNEVLEFDPTTSRVYHTQTGKPFTGDCQACYDNGNVQHIANFRDGKEDGESRSYYKDGSPESLRNFEYGKEHGDWKFWYTAAEGGQLAWEFQYNEGEKHGKWIWYYKDEAHSVKKVENYNMGKFEGAVEKYYGPGKLKSKISFNGGLYDGPYITYHENGQVSAELGYKNNKEDGLVKHYFESGQISLEGEWKSGKKVGKWTTYFRNGAERTSENYDNGIQQGKFYEFYEEGGKLKREATYENGYLMEEFLFDQYGNAVDDKGRKLDDEEVKSRNDIIKATAENRMRGEGKKGKKPKFDFSTIDNELMCECIKAEMAGEEITEECEGAKKSFRDAMAKASKKDQKKMRKMISECEGK